MEKIKLCFIHYKLVLGGAETALLDLVRLIDKNRFEVSVFLMEIGGVLEKEFIKEGVRLLNPFYRLKKSKWLHKKAYNYIKNHQIYRAISKDSNRLLKITTKEKFDIVVSYHTELNCNNIGMPKHTKTIKYIHSDLSTNEYFKERMEYIKHLKKPYDKIICVSEQARKSFIETYGIDKNVVTLLNPIDATRIQVLSNEKVVLPFRGKYICAVGRLGWEKGYDRLILLQKRLKEMSLDYKLLIVGDGSEKKKLTKMIEDNHLQDDVFLIGYQSNPYPYILHSYFTVISSYTEGLPVVAVESLCLGIPVVSCFSSVKEAFGEEKCGIITDNDDEALFNGMLDLFNNENLYNIVKNGAESRREFFSGRTLIKQVENEYIHTIFDDNYTETKIFNVDSC